MNDARDNDFRNALTLAGRALRAQGIAGSFTLGRRGVARTVRIAAEMTIATERRALVDVAEVLRAAGFNAHAQSLEIVVTRAAADLAA